MSKIVQALPQTDAEGPPPAAAAESSQPGPQGDFEQAFLIGFPPTDAGQIMGLVLQVAPQISFQVLQEAQLEAQQIPAGALLILPHRLAGGPSQ